MLFQARYTVRHFGLDCTPETVEVEKTDPTRLKRHTHKLSDSHDLCFRCQRAPLPSS